MSTSDSSENQNSSSSTPSQNDIPGRIKDYGRESRLSFRNFAEHQLRNEFKEKVLQKCSLQLEAFADCSKEEGLMVVFRCRDFYRDVQECMAVYNSEGAWEKFKRDHEADLAHQAVPSKP